MRKTCIDYFESHWTPEPYSGCWLWHGRILPDGYGRCKLDNRDSRAHRVSWNLFKGDIPAGMNVCHRCDTPLCVNPEHLFLGTVLDNNRDSISKRRNQHGERQWMARLDRHQVSSIRRDLRSYSQICEQYGISHGHVGAIKAGRTWKRLPQ